MRELYQVLVKTLDLKGEELLSVLKILGSEPVVAPFQVPKHGHVGKCRAHSEGPLTGLLETDAGSWEQ